MIDRTPMKRPIEQVEAPQPLVPASRGERADLRSDRRSVQAMLTGRDDDRVDLYELFCTLSRVGDLSDEYESVTAKYSKFELNAHVNTRYFPKRWREAATRYVLRFKLYAMFVKRVG